MIIFIMQFIVQVIKKWKGIKIMLPHLYYGTSMFHKGSYLTDHKLNKRF